MIPPVICVYKKPGETPLQCLERTREEYGISSSIPMTYAGRLDPMAEGVLILLIGEECKKKDQYLNLDKTYEFEVLVGFSTDTYDLLGLQASPNKQFERSLPIGRQARDQLSTDLNQTVRNIPSDFVSALYSSVGTFIQTYPPFSSKTVGGRQLFQLSIDNTLPEVLPSHEVTIRKLTHMSSRTISREELKKEIIERISGVEGDFRQDAIIELWQQALAQSLEKEFSIFSCKVECSSGTYIRQLVEDISRKINIPLVTYSIKRRRVGEYLIPASSTN